jgi:hypothetical protein
MWALPDLDCAQSSTATRRRRIASTQDVSLDLDPEEIASRIPESAAIFSGSVR